MSDPRTRLLNADGSRFIARENADCRITCQLVDALGAGIPVANLATVTLTLYADDGAKSVINTVSDVDIKNTGRATIDITGNMVLTLGPADNPVLDVAQSEEIHVALIEWTYNGGASAGRQELEFPVRNMARVP